MQHFVDYINRGGPVVGLRTSTHAFQIRNKDAKFRRYSTGYKGEDFKDGFGEQILGGDIDERTDIFSLGAIAYEMITRQKAFPGDQSAAILYKITNEDANAHLLKIDLGTNDKNFNAWAWSIGNGHLSSKAYLELSKRIMATSEKKNDE